VGYPEEDAERVFQTVMIAVAFVIGAAVTIGITGPTILDSNPTSYIIVTMIMSVLFIFFTLKDKHPVTRGDFGVIGAAIAFVIYIVLLSYGRGSLSFEFLSYRIDALLLPLFLLCVVSAVAGLRGIKRFAPVMAYLLFASPILLMPLLTSNGGLSSFSAGIVYSIMKATGANVVQNGLQIVAPSGQAISIATTCVPVGTFVAFLMLLVPISYLFNGRPSRKAAWLGCGVVLLFVLNIIRMAIISLAWAYSGLSSAVSTFHAFGGALIFYISIIAIFLVYRKFGLKLEFGHEWTKRLELAFSAFDIEENYGKISTALIIAFAVLLLSLGYIGASNVSAALFNGSTISNSTYAQLYQNTITRLNASKVGYSYLGSYQGTMLFELGKTNPMNSTYLVVAFYPYPEKGANILFYSANPSPSSYILRSGATVTSLAAKSNNATFYISYFATPIIVNGSAYSANFEVFANAGSKGTLYCDPSTGSGMQQYIESGIFNLIKSQQSQPVLCLAQQIALTKI
jgi:exosortase/archaeosortase family protein